MKEGSVWHKSQLFACSQKKRCLQKVDVKHFLNTNILYQPQNVQPKNIERGEFMISESTTATQALLCTSVYTEIGFELTAQ